MTINYDNNYYCCTVIICTNLYIYIYIYNSYKNKYTIKINRIALRLRNYYTITNKILLIIITIEYY